MVSASILDESSYRARGYANFRVVALLKLFNMLQVGKIPQSVLYDLEQIIGELKPVSIENEPVMKNQQIPVERMFKKTKRCIFTKMNGM
jgi:hypothetical protein